MTIKSLNNYNNLILSNDDEYKLLIDEYNEIIKNYDKELEIKE